MIKNTFLVASYLKLRSLSSLTFPQMHFLVLSPDRKTIFLFSKPGRFSPFWNFETFYNQFPTICFCTGLNGSSKIDIHLTLIFFSLKDFLRQIGDWNILQKYKTIVLWQYLNNSNVFVCCSFGILFSVIDLIYTLSSTPTQ